MLAHFSKEYKEDIYQYNFEPDHPVVMGGSGVAVGFYGLYFLLLLAPLLLLSRFLFSPSLSKCEFKWSRNSGSPVTRWVALLSSI